MLTPKISDLCQSRLTLERLNEQYYRALSAAADVVNRPGAKAYFDRCADDERDHARRVTEYLVDQNERPLFDALPVIPDIDGTNYAGMFTLALNRERYTTAAYRELWTIAALEEHDAQTVAFVTNPGGDFPGFLAEQTQSERELNDHLLKIQRLQPDGLEIFDQWLEEQYKK
jgi:ferritin